MDDIDLLVVLRKRARWQGVWMAILVASVVGIYLAAQLGWDHTGIAAGAIIAGVAGANAIGQARDTTRLLDRYVAQDPAVQDQIEMLDGTRLKRRLAATQTKTDST